MGLKVTSETYNTISYKFLNGGRSLVVIFPRAGARFLAHEKLLVSLNKFKSVLFLESGYFGISRIKQNLENIGMDSFRDNLHSLINKLGYKKLILVGESVGAIHALNYASHYKDEVEIVILSNPALYKPKWLYRLILIPILNLGIKSSPNTLLKGLSKLLMQIPKKGSKKLAETFIRMNHRIGATSYLACLKEIVDFSYKYESENVKSVLNKTFVLKGKNDIVFDLLCNNEYCKNCLSYIEVPSLGHGIIDTNPKVVVSLLS